MLGDIRAFQCHLGVVKIACRQGNQTKSNLGINVLTQTFQGTEEYEVGLDQLPT